MDNINMNLLKYFYYVAKYNSYTKAAEELMVSQPSLSYSIKVLENQLNKKLLNRNRQIELTPYGKYVYEEVSKIMEIVNEFSSTNEEISGKIIIGMRTQYANRIFPFYVNELNNIYPKLKIEYLLAPPARLKELFYNDEIDILIDEYEYNGIYESFIQFTDKMLFFTGNNNDELIDDNIISKSDICIVYPNKVSKEIKELYSFNYVDFQSTPIMINSIINNKMIGISPKSVINDELESGKLIEIKTNYELPEAKMFISYNKKLKNKNIDVVVDYFKEHSFYDLKLKKEKCKLTKGTSN